MMQVMVLADELITTSDIGLTAQQAEVAMFQNVLFLCGKVSAFAFTHAASVKKRRENVPNKMITP
jgi:hypothetical protein